MEQIHHLLIRTAEAISIEYSEETHYKHWKSLRQLIQDAFAEEVFQAALKLQQNK